MSTLSKLNRIEIGNTQTSNTNTLECSPIYIPAYIGLLVGIAICLIGQLEHKTSVPISNYLTNSVCFWLPVLYFFFALDFSGWFLFQSPFLKTILPLPLPSDKIQSYFRDRNNSPLTIGALRILYSFAIACMIGLHKHSFLWAVLVFFYAFTLFWVIEFFAVIVLTKTFRKHLKMRRILFLIPALIFPVTSALLLSGTPISQSSQTFLDSMVKFNLFPINTPFYIWIIGLILLMHLFGYLYKLEMRIWNRNINRDALVETAFPLLSAGRKRRLKTVFDINLRNSPASQPHSSGRVAQILKRAAFLFVDNFGAIHTKKVIIALSAAFILPPILLLFNFRFLHATMIMAIPSIAVWIFVVINLFKNNNQPFLHYALPVGFLESRIVFTVVALAVFIISGLETIALVEFLKYFGLSDVHRPLTYLLLDLAEFVILAASFIAALIGLSYIAITKRTLRYFFAFSLLQISTAMFMFIMMIGAMYSMLELSKKIFLQNIAQEDCLAFGFKGICIFIVGLINPSTAGVGEKINKLLEATVELSLQIPTAPFIAPAWLLFVSTCIFSWYYFVKYGQKLPKTYTAAALLSTLQRKK